MLDLVNTLGNFIYRKLKAQKNTTDLDLMNEMNKSGMNVSPRELNKALMQLEIMGLITVRWSGKDRRRIDIIEKAEEPK